MATKPTKLEIWSAPILLFIHGLPRWVFPAVTAALLLTGLFVSNGIIGGVCLVIVGVVLGWLVLLSWKLLLWPSRVIRAALIALVFGYALGRFLGSV